MLNRKNMLSIKKLYLASSWRNVRQPDAVAALRASGFDVYDFRNPAEGNHGFGWRQCTNEDPPWTGALLREVLTHPVAVEGHALDHRAMVDADACVLLLPCGRSAHLEAGLMAGWGKPVLVWIPEGEAVEPELMYSSLGNGRPICVTQDEVIARLRDWRWTVEGRTP